MGGADKSNGREKEESARKGKIKRVSLAIATWKTLHTVKSVLFSRTTTPTHTPTHRDW